MDYGIMKNKSKNTFIDSGHQETLGLPNQYSQELTQTIPTPSDDTELALTKDAQFVKEFVGQDIKRIDDKIIDVKDSIKEKTKYLNEKIQLNKQSILDNKKIFNKNFTLFWIILAITFPILFFVAPLLVNKEDFNKIAIIESNVFCFKDSLQNTFNENKNYFRSEIDSLQNDVIELKNRVKILNKPKGAKIE